MTEEEFQQTASRLRPQLIDQASRYLTESDGAEDAVQDVLLRLWQIHERLRPPIERLASVMTRNVCIDLLRRRHPQVNSQELAANAMEADDNERIERLMAVVDHLPDLQQALLRLRHMQGMEMKELASLFQMNETAVRKALSRARMAVRNEYLKRQRNEEDR